MRFAVTAILFLNLLIFLYILIIACRIEKIVKWCNEWEEEEDASTNRNPQE